MKKRWLVTATCVALGLMVSAQSPTEVEFWSWYLSPKYDPYLQGVIEAFQKSKPGIKIKLVDKQDGIERDLQAAIAAGKSPDVVNLRIDSTIAAAQNNLLEPIVGLTSNEILNAQYWPNAINMFNLDGKAYGYPWYGWTDQGMMAYNSELLQKAGIVKLPKTFTELLDASKLIKEKTGAYGWLPALKDPNNASFLTMFYLEGLPILKDGKAVFNSPAHAALLEKFVNLVKADVLPQDLLRKESIQLSTDLYSQGKCAFLIGGAQMLIRIKDTNKDLYAKTKITDTPLGAAGVQPGGALSLVIPKASKNKKEAAAFALFLSNNKNQVQFSKLVGIVPTTKGAENDPELKPTNANDAIDVATSLVSSVGKLIGLAWKAPKNSDDVYKNFNDNIEAVFAAKKKSQDALNDAVDYWNKK